MPAAHIADRWTVPRLLACGLALTIAFAGTAHAQDDDDDDGPAAPPIVVNIDGPCALTVDDMDVPCRGVAYMVFPSNGRIDFTAITQTAGWSFSGENDDNEDGDYALEIDSVLGPSAGRVEADGECDMQVAEDRRTVMSLECQAATDQGELTLHASGDHHRRRRQRRRQRIDHLKKRLLPPRWWKASSLLDA